VPFLERVGGWHRSFPSAAPRVEISTNDRQAMPEKENGPV
jgi:hypothetical protein